MRHRSAWIKKIEAAFARRNVVWLSGVRRAGKTTLARSLSGVAYFDCELLRVREQLADPEGFFSAHRGHEHIVIDEIHRLANPSEVLKIAADHFPKTRVLATGSSTLAAKSKFKDTLTGRKTELWLTPMLLEDMHVFSSDDIDRRILHGGLPPFFLAPTLDDYAFEEWMDSYWAKDLTELFVVDKKTAFMKFFELVLTQSGQLFEAQAFTAPCEVSRQTIMNYLQILETTLVATVIRPFHISAATEIKSQPKVYGFDTGFVAYCKGIEGLRDDDRGFFLEHLVLNELLARFGRSAVHFWRDKQKHEVDFILQKGRTRAVTAIECKLQSKAFDPTHLRAFRKLHATGENWLVTLKDRGSYDRKVGDLVVKVIPLHEFGRRLES